MTKSTETIAIVLLLTLSQLHDTDAVIKYFNQTIFHPEKHVTYNEYAFIKGNLVYTVCDGTTVKKVCTVFQRKFPYNEVTHSCDNVILEVNGTDNDKLSKEVYVRALGQENAILFYGEMGTSPKFNLIAIEMNSCKNKTIQLEDPENRVYYQQVNSHRILALSDSSFFIFFDDLILPNTPLDILVGKHVSFHNEYPFFNATTMDDGEVVAFMFVLSSTLSHEKFVYATIRNQTHSLWLLKLIALEDRYEKKLLTSFKKPGIGVSVGHDLITTCVNSENVSQIICTRFDNNGDVNFNVTFNHGNEDVTKIKTVHNTRDGSFLLMTKSVNMSGGEADYNMRPNSYDIIKVDGKGKKVGTVRLNDFLEITGYVKTHRIWEKEQKYCAALISQSSQDQLNLDTLNIIVSCFTNEDFESE